MSTATVRILVTGAHGFIGSHLRAAAARDPRVEVEVLPRQALTRPSELLSSVERAQVVVHLAGLNRATDEEILGVNADLVGRIRDACAASATPTHVLFASSTHRTRDDAYGRSKREGEASLLAAAEQDSFALTVLEMSNVFGPGCRPFYNSVVATFAHQVATGQPPTIDIDREMELLWVDDVVRGILDLSTSPPPQRPARWNPVGDVISVSRLLEVLNEQWRQHQQERVVPAIASRLEGNLYRTLVSYTPAGSHAYPPVLRADARGWLFEAIRQSWAGSQSFVSSSKPGVIRGQHYHTRKMEKFCVVQGEGIIRLRRLHTEDVLEYRVSGAQPTVVDIPVFFVHNLENVGTHDMLTIFWSSEIFDPEDPDTIPEDV